MLPRKKLKIGLGNAKSKSSHGSQFTHPNEKSLREKSDP